MARRTLVSVTAFVAVTAALALVATVPAAGQALIGCEVERRRSQGGIHADPDAGWAARFVGILDERLDTTPLQRPKSVTKEFYTPAELEELAAAVLRENARDHRHGNAARPAL